MNSANDSGEGLVRDENEFTARLREHSRLMRFFCRNIVEALHLPAEKLRFRFEAQKAVLEFCRVDVPIRTVDIRPDLWKPLLRWLRARYLLQDYVGARNFDPESTSGVRFASAARLQDQVSQFQVTYDISPDRSTRTITISELRLLSLEAAAACCGYSEESGALLETVLGSSNGLIVLASSDPDQLGLAAGSIRAMSDLEICCNLDQIPASGLAPATHEELFLVFSKSTDPLDLLKKNWKSFKESNARIAGIIVAMVFPQLCIACRKETSFPSALQSFIPKHLRPPNAYKAEGCLACNKTGRRGFISLQSVLEVDEELREMLDSDASGPDLYTFVVQRGSNTILADALRKSSQGLLDLDDFLASSPELKPVHLLSLGQIESEVMQPGPLDAAYQSAMVSGEGAAYSPEKNEQVSRKDPPKPLLMVVEDDPDQRNILELTLKSARYDVLLANDGRAALKILENQFPDLIITDLMMPGMDGSELVRILKSSEDLKRIPILILTVVGDVEREFQLLELGADDYCEKSMQRKIFLKRVENLLRRSKNAA